MSSFDVIVLKDPPSLDGKDDQKADGQTEDTNEPWIDESWIQDWINFILNIWKIIDGLIFLIGFVMLIIISSVGTPNGSLAFSSDNNHWASSILALHLILQFIRCNFIKGDDEDRNRSVLTFLIFSCSFLLCINKIYGHSESWILLPIISSVANFIFFIFWENRFQQNFWICWKKFISKGSPRDWFKRSNGDDDDDCSIFKVLMVSDLVLAAGALLLVILIGFLRPDDGITCREYKVLTSEIDMMWGGKEKTFRHEWVKIPIQYCSVFISTMVLLVLHMGLQLVRVYLFKTNKTIFLKSLVSLSVFLSSLLLILFGYGQWGLIFPMISCLMNGLYLLMIQLARREGEEVVNGCTKIRDTYQTFRTFDALISTFGLSVFLLIFIRSSLEGIFLGFYYSSILIFLPRILAQIFRTLINYPQLKERLKLLLISTSIMILADIGFILAGSLWWLSQAAAGGPSAPTLQYPSGSSYTPVREDYRGSRFGENYETSPAPALSQHPVPSSSYAEIPFYSFLGTAITFNILFLIFLMVGVRRLRLRDLYLRNQVTFVRQIC